MLGRNGFLVLITFFVMGGIGFGVFFVSGRNGNGECSGSDMDITWECECYDDCSLYPPYIYERFDLCSNCPFDMFPCCDICVNHEGAGCGSGRENYPCCDYEDWCTNDHCCSDGVEWSGGQCQECTSSTPCGTTCPDTGVGVCSGSGLCYPAGGCSLHCTIPPGSDERVCYDKGVEIVCTDSESQAACGRTGSYKLNNVLICSGSTTSCSMGGGALSISLPDPFVYNERPVYSGGHWPAYTTGDIVPIELRFIGDPGSFTRLSECKLIKSDGTALYLDNWGVFPDPSHPPGAPGLSYIAKLSYTIQPDVPGPVGDPEGTWKIEYCGFWSDFEPGGGSLLQIDNTDYYFIVDNTMPMVWVEGAPGGWTTSADADVGCSDAVSGCDTGTYKLKIYDSNPPAFCPHNYNDYDKNPQTITSHVWICAAAKDRAGIVGTSSGGPVEFLVGQERSATDDDGGNVPEVPGTCIEVVDSEEYYFPDRCTGIATITEYFPDSDARNCITDSHDCSTFDGCNPSAVCPGDTCVYHKYTCVGMDSLCGNGVCDPGENTDNCKHDCCKDVCNAIKSEDVCVASTQGGCNCSWPIRQIQPIPPPTCNCDANDDCATGYCRLSTSCTVSGGNTGLCATPGTGDNCFDCTEICPGAPNQARCDLVDMCYWASDILGCMCSLDGYLLRREEASCDYYDVDLDSLQDYCDGCLGTGSWDIGGDISTCCGDDDYDSITTEQSSTDAPSGYNDGGTACCDDAGDCQNDDVCTAAGEVSGSAWCCSTAEESGCSATYWYGPDAFASACTDLVGANLWDIGGDISTCCGDDASEHYNYVRGRHTGNYYDVAWSDDTGIDACCDSLDDCVGTDGNCYYDHESASGFNPGGNDDISVCEWGPGDENWWFDCDYDATSCSDCGLNRVAGGEDDAFGEYDTGTATGCCGDDASENYIYRTAYKTVGAYHVSWDDDTSDSACCNSDEDCVYGGGCYSNGENADIAGVTNDKTVRCNGGSEHWLDVDYGSGGCTGAGHVWSAAGETGVGEYGSATDGGDGTTECCGDDSSESYVTRAVGTDSTYPSDANDKTCCSSGSDCVHSSACFNDGEIRGSIPGRNYCDDGTWYGGDYSSDACTAIVGSGYWNLGGDVASTECCGDDASENKRTCQDSGLGACTESTDDEACCSDSSACVYNNVCYSHDGAAGGWVCNQGTWEGLSVTVAVTATPGSVTTTWQSAGASAGISCTPHPSTECDTNSYRLETHSSDPGSCSTTYADYTLASPQAIASHVWVCGAAKDNHGTEGFSAPVRFFVDQINPTASLGSLPAWTTQNSVIVTWSGSDGESGLDYFELQYRITMVDGTETQGWTAWGSNPTSGGSLPFSGMANNRTYHFRARATDNVGNTVDWSAAESISVDLVDPTCAVWNLPLYVTSSSFTVSWEGSDGESGIDYYDVQVRDGSGDWGYLNDPDGYQTTETMDDVLGVDGHTYYFRCRATDIAGNEGEWSGEKSTTVDATEPTSSVEDLERWINITSFTVSWSGFDETSGIDCYGINWSDGSGWNSWFACTQEVSATFGPDSPATVSHGVTYSFVSSARDLAGWAEDWPSQEDTLTTIDTVKPEYDVHAYDQNDNEIMGFVSPAVVETVTIRSTATDSVSGIEHNYIEYLVIDEDGERSDSVDCGSADPYGGISECDVDIGFGDGTSIEFWVRVIDRAGNENISDTFQIGTHPLANFGKRRLHLTIGESSKTKVHVRNMLEQVDDVTVMLSSTLPVPPYFIWVDDPDVEISGDKQTLVAKNMNPNEERLFYVMMWSSEPPDIYYVDLSAHSAVDEDLLDSDQAVVQIGYPASFPGLNEWAIIILIVLAVSAYFWFGKKK